MRRWHIRSCCAMGGGEGKTAYREIDDYALYRYVLRHIYDDLDVPVCVVLTHWPSLNTKTFIMFH